MAIRKLLRGWFCGSLSIAFLFLGGLEAKIYPQASVNVSTLDSVYRDIDKLVAHGLIAKIIVGQRPYSRREIARLTAEALYQMKRVFEEPLADPNLSDKKKKLLLERKAYVQEILRRLMRDYHEELVALGAIQGKKSWYSAHPIDKIYVDMTVSNSRPRVVPDNGTGRIDAVINPMLQYRQGRHLVDGANLSLETTHWVRATDYFALFVQPRFQLAIGRDGQADDNKVFIQNLYSKFFFKNFEIEVGRDNLFWGQGQNAGLLLSNNPRGLDMIKISNDDPSFLPWYFKYLGANKISFFYSDLGPEQNFPHAYLTGWKWSLQPLSFFEIGASLLVQSGGKGSPQASFGQRVGDVFPLAHVFAGSQDEIGNKMAGFDLRFRIPRARGMEIYAEIIFDDIHREVPKLMFVDDTGYVGGVFLPRLTDSGSVDLRMEYHRTGLRFYQHGQFFSGLTLNRFILGDALGPNAQGVYVDTKWDIDSHHLLSFQGAYERRSADVYTYVTPIDAPEFFIKLQDKPEESRVQVGGRWLYRVPDLPILLKTQLGYERVFNFNFISGNDRNNFLGEVSLQIDLDRWSRFPK